MIETRQLLIARDYDRVFVKCNQRRQLIRLAEEIKFWSDRLDRNSKDEVAVIKTRGFACGSF